MRSKDLRVLIYKKFLLNKNCEVHTGFLTAYSYFKNTIITKFKKLIIKYPSAKILVTGHSLGGALATLAVPDLMEEIEKIDFLYSFGSPRVGNSYFANFINGFFTNKGFSARITHYHDLVPHLPNKILGYHHINNEIYYNEENKEYAICTDEEGCSNSNLINSSLKDHRNYMGIPTSDYVKLCRNK
jgi:predicted lipase